MPTGWSDTNGVATRHSLEGDRGPLVVLVHEMGGCKETWDAVVSRLCPDFRIFRYDSRGAGLSEKISADVAIEDLAADLASLLDVLNVNERVLIAGCAVGAAVAISCADRHPARVGGILAMNPALSVPAQNLKDLLDYAAELLSKGTRPLAEGAMSTGYPPILRERDPKRYEQFRLRWLCNDPVSLAHLAYMLSRTDLRPVLHRIHCPVLVLSGVHDRLRTIDYVQSLASTIPDCQVRSVDAGHHMADQAPEEVADAIRALADRARSYLGAN